MKVLVSGSSGLIGVALVAHLASQGDTPIRLVRGRAPRDESEIAWDPDAGSIDTKRLEGIDAVVNLAGASIARWPWNAAHKRRVIESRVRATSLLTRSVAELARHPRVVVSASGIGYYGDRGDEVLHETSAPGTGFLAGVTAAWESAATPAAQAGIRVSVLRIGMVLSRAGGALPPLALPFRLGLGGTLGSGRQYMSWIAIEDLVQAIAHVLRGDDLGGPINAVSPHPVTNTEFTKALGRALHRPTLFPVPAFALRLLLGEMAQELLLASQRAEPVRLLGSGFPFRHPNLVEALEVALK